MLGGNWEFQKLFKKKTWQKPTASTASLSFRRKWSHLEQHVEWLLGGSKSPPLAAAWSGRMPLGTAALLWEGNWGWQHCWSWSLPPCKKKGENWRASDWHGFGTCWSEGCSSPSIGAVRNNADTISAVLHGFKDSPFSTFEKRREKGEGHRAVWNHTLKKVAAKCAPWEGSVLGCVMVQLCPKHGTVGRLPSLTHTHTPVHQWTNVLKAQLGTCFKSQFNHEVHWVVLGSQGFKENSNMLLDTEV